MCELFFRNESLVVPALDPRTGYHAANHSAFRDANDAIGKVRINSDEVLAVFGDL
ncbi:hypothetical protein D3C84_1315650 [compost metagenome]